MVVVIIMNYLEISKIINEMIYKTEKIKTNIYISSLKKGLIIDKNCK